MRIIQKIKDKLKYYRFSYIPQYLIASNFSSQSFYICYKFIYGFLIFLLGFLNYSDFRSKYGKFKLQIYPDQLYENNETPLFCFIALSGGEVTQIIDLINELYRESVIDINVLVLVGNDEGLIDLLKKKMNKKAKISLIPLDTEFSTKRFIDLNMPDLMIYVENVYSPILAKSSKSYGIENILISGLTRSDTKNHPIYKRAFGLNFEKYIDQFFIKSDLDYPYLLNNGVEESKIINMGNLKYLEVIEEKSNHEASNEIMKIKELLKKDKLIIMGSISFEERDFIISSIDNILSQRDEMAIIICPRFKYLVPIYQRLLHDCSLPSIRLSEVTENIRRLDKEIIVVDIFGALNDLYSIADLAVVGGSFEKRFHTGFSQNLIEPMIKNIPVLYGPYTLQFDDLVNEINHESQISICNSPDQLSELINELLSQERLLNHLVEEQNRALKKYSKHPLHNYKSLIFNKLNNGEYER